MLDIKVGDVFQLLLDIVVCDTLFPKGSYTVKSIHTKFDCIVFKHPKGYDASMTFRQVEDRLRRGQAVLN